MAGGTWIAQNKIRPGAYINFKSVAAPTITIGNRGIITMAMNLKWGEEGKLINVYSTDLSTGDSLKKIGLTFDSPEAKLLRLALSNAYLCKVYRLNTSGTAASGTIDKSIKAIAKCTGEFGNKIVIVKKPIDELGNIFDIITYADGYEVDVQRIKTADDLVENDFVKFEKVEAEDEKTTETVTLVLSGGEDGNDSGNGYENYLKLLRINQWQTLAVTDTTNNDKAIAFIKDVRENEGLYVQAVVNDNEGANSDYEGIINSVSSVVINGEIITAAEFTAWVAGATAGAEITISNTGKIVEGATEITNLMSNQEIEEALKTGKFVLSLNQNGSIKVEKDINSLHTYSQDRNYAFSKNRVIRTLDEIGTNIKNTWETTYLGKVSNNEDGRTMFKSSIIDYLTGLENQGAIQDFDPATVSVQKGNDIDAVVADITVKPVDSMEFLYMTVNVTD